MKTRKNKKNNKLSKSKSKKRVFTKKDYAAPDGMQTYAWGPAMWHSLHMISFNYPVEPTSQQKKQ